MIDGKTRIFATAYVELREAVIKLREAQRAYMANRGDEKCGLAVADAAAKVDEILIADGHRYDDNHLIPADVARDSKVTFPETYVKS